MGRLERNQSEKEIVKRSIMDAALNIAVSDGWNAVSIRKIADAIKYAPPIVYEHFKNKDDLLNELVVLGHQILGKSNISSIKRESEPRKILMSISENFWDFAFSHKELYELMFSLNRAIPEKEINALIQSIIKIFTQLVGNGELAKEAMFSWMCFQQGIIYNIKQMGLPPDFGEADPREFYVRAMSKYIARI